MPNVCGNEICRPERLCDPCLGRELFAKKGQAEALGQVWAEKICHKVTFTEWPRGPHVTAIARQKVQVLTRDRRLWGELAAACEAGAASWWARRPVRCRGSGS